MTFRTWPLREEDCSLELGLCHCGFAAGRGDVDGEVHPRQQRKAGRTLPAVSLRGIWLLGVWDQVVLTDVA